MPIRRDIYENLYRMTENDEITWHPENEITYSTSRSGITYTLYYSNRLMLTSKDVSTSWSENSSALWFLIDRKLNKEPSENQLLEKALADLTKT